MSIITPDPEDLEDVLNDRAVVEASGADR